MEVAIQVVAENMRKREFSKNVSRNEKVSKNSFLFNNVVTLKLGFFGGNVTRDISGVKKLILILQELS